MEKLPGGLLWVSNSAGLDSGHDAGKSRRMIWSLETLERGGETSDEVQ